jgi:hypothetical protein
MRAFLIILKGLMLDYYYNINLLKLLYLKTYKKLYMFFKPLEYYCINLNKWNSITLNIITVNYLDKTIRKVV